MNRVSEDLVGLGALGDPEELWSAFKTTILDVAGGCLGTIDSYREGLEPPMLGVCNLSLKD